MKWIALIILLVAGFAHAGESSGSASDFGVGPNTYCVVAATPYRLILELRRYSDDQLLHDVVLMSRYMVPEYNIDDVVLDDAFEIIVRTRGGGTGIAETHLEVFGIVADKIVQFGDFVIDRKFIHLGYQEKRSGTVSFPEKNRLIYQYSDSTVRDGKTASKDVTETYTFDSKTMRYKSTKDPEQAAPADRR
jgi:hypothetical protein